MVENVTKLKILQALPEEYRDLPVFVYDSLPSTNDTAKEAARKGAPHGSLFLCHTQTRGRGRRGRSFFSPPGAGLYMSLVLRPEKGDPVGINSTAAVAVCRAIEDTAHLFPKIKWVNDLLLEEKKICGILAEGAAGAVILGIGVNLLPTAYPKELKDIAGCLNVPSLSREELCAAITDRLLTLLKTPGAFLEDYKARCHTLGKDIRFEQNGLWQEARAIDIRQDGALIVQFSDGRKEALFSGEITLRTRPLSAGV